jgi:cytochrome d ubiquinol oxidase subunit I
LLGAVLVIMTGHSQAQHMVETQPMKMAAAEALWNTEDPAGMSLFTIGDEQAREDVVALRVPRLLSLLAFNQLDGTVQGINDLQREYEQRYGPGDYVPPVAVSYWTFRIMVGAGFLMLLAVLYGMLVALGEQTANPPRLLRFFPFLIVMPYLANIAGWLLTEMGRVPWVVFGLMKIEDAVSPLVPAGTVLASLIVFTLLYGALMVADVYLLAKYGSEGSLPASRPESSEQPAISLVGD